MQQMFVCQSGRIESNPENAKGQDHLSSYCTLQKPDIICDTIRFDGLNLQGPAYRIDHGQANAWLQTLT